MDQISAFNRECEERIRGYGNNQDLKESSIKWVKKSWSEKYSYNFSWMGRPIIQLPQDMIAMQEIIWEVRPDLILEAGIAHGGSLIFYASILELLGGEGEVLGIDIDIRDHNRREIERHPMSRRIRMIQGSSIAPETIEKVKGLAKEKNRIIVCLDSCHEKEHVLSEMKAYSDLVSMGSYMVVFDTIVEDLAGVKGAREDFDTNNPKAAVREFLSDNSRFEVSEKWDHKLLVTHNPGGFLRRVR